MTLHAYSWGFKNRFVGRKGIFDCYNYSTEAAVRVSISMYTPTRTYDKLFLFIALKHTSLQLQWSRTGDVGSWCHSLYACVWGEPIL